MGVTMFIAFIAVALELAALAFGAKVVLSYYKACFRRSCLCSDKLRSGENIPLERTESSTSYVREHPLRETKAHEKHDCLGLMKFIGYFTIILSFIALVGTLIAFGCFIKDVKDLERHHDVPSEQYRFDLDKLRIYTGNDGSFETYRIIP